MTLWSRPLPSRPVTISTVIFDFGGVVSSPLFVGLGAFEEAEGFRPGSLLSLLFGDTSYIGVEGRAVAAAMAADPDGAEAAGEIADEPDWHLLEKGEIDIATYFERLVRKAPTVLGRTIDMDAYARFWRNSAPGVHWMTVHKMRALRESGLRVSLLTNNVREFGENWRSMFPVDELCEDVVDSSHVGMRKPEPGIYLLACERLGVTPEETIFVDDNAENISAARALGMEAVHFIEPWESIAEIDAILDRRGVHRDPRRPV